MGAAGGLRRWPAAVLALALTAAVGMPAGAVPAGAVPAGDDLAQTRDRLGAAQRDLTELERLVRDTAEEVAAIDQRLTTATTELHRIETQLAAAEAALQAARAQERRAAADRAAADIQLADTLDQWADHRSQLEQQAIAAYKRGYRGAPELLMRGVAGAADWHEVAVTVETVQRIVASEHARSEQAAASTLATVAARDVVTRARAAAVAAQRQAAAHQREVEALLARQRGTVTEVDRQLATRRQVLASLEADAAARAVLVADLQRRVAELELAATLAIVPVRLDLDMDGPPPAWAAGLPAHGRGLAAAIDAAAAQQGMDGRLLAAVVWTESNFRPDAVSHAGAIGLAQLMPGTARMLRVDPWDPHANLVGGARYLRQQLDRFARLDLALAAYNAGPGRITAAGNQIPDIVETQLYVVRVLERYKRLRG